MFCRKVTMMLFPIMLSSLVFAQAVASQPQSEEDREWKSSLAVHIFGYEDVPKGASGVVEITPGVVAFVQGEEELRLSRSQIISATEDEERHETGGATGKIIRFAVPYGGGALIGAFSQEQVGLLTLDYRDLQGGFHSAVFMMSKADATSAADQLNTLPRPSTVHAFAPPPCAVLNTSLIMKVSEVDADPGVVLAPEYRALLYEHVVELPSKKSHFDQLIRDGNTSADCAPYLLALHVERLSKGSDVTRTVTGPLGLFVSVTKIHVHVVVSDRYGNVVLDRLVRASRRGDSESLNAADSAANAIAKSLRQVSDMVQKRVSE